MISKLRAVGAWMVEKFKKYVLAHKIIAGIVLIALATGGYFLYQYLNTGTTVTKYEVQSIATGTISTSVSGTGQIAAGATVSVSPKVSEEVTSIAVKVGDKVSANQILLRLDATTEQRSVNSAKLSLESAKLAYNKLSEVTTSTLLSSQSSVRQAETSLATASSSLVSDYQSDFDSLSSSFVSLQTVMTGLQDFVTGNDINTTQDDPDAYVGLMPDYLQSGVLPYKNKVQAAYTAAAAAYAKNLTDYRAASRTSDQATLDSLFTETSNTANTVSAAVKASKDFLTYVVNSYPSASSSTKPLPTITTTLQSNFSTYTTSIASVASSVENTITGLANDRTSITNAASSLEQAQENLSELTSGPTDSELLSAEINLESAQNALTTAEQNLNYTVVRAPIEGTVSAISATVGQTAGSGAVTIVSTNEVADITLDELDAANVAVGDKATLTFDAIDGLSIEGTVAQVDPVGTVSQGVVSYGIEIAFSQTATTSSSMQVKPGMSVTADIVTASRTGVIVVPSTAITTQGNASYVLVPATALTTQELKESMNGGSEIEVKRVIVTTGLVGDTTTEITIGLAAGDQVVVKTVKSTATASSKTTTSGSTSALQLLSGSTSGGGGGTPPSGGTSGGGGGPPSQ